MPQDSILAPIDFNIFINDLEEERKCTLSKSVNNLEVGGAVNTLKGRTATQKVFNISERSGLNILLKTAAFMLFVSSTEADYSAITLKGLLNAQLFLIFNGMLFLKKK